MLSPSDPLLAHLAAHDAECPVCGYQLRGVAAPVCPECAAPLRLTVASDHTKPGPWLVALIACALALGFDAVVFLLLLVGVVASLVARGVPDPQALVIAALFGSFALASGVALAVVLRRRRAWALWRRRSQWVIGWATFFGVGLVHVGFAVLVVALLS